VLNRMPDHRAAPGARCAEARNSEASRIRGGKPLRSRGPTDVSRADEQYVQGGLLVQRQNLSRRPDGVTLVLNDIIVHPVC